MKLSKAQRLAITTTIGSQVEARPNTLASLVRLGLAETHTERGRLTGRAVTRHYLTETGRTVRNAIRTAENAEREQADQEQHPASLSAQPTNRRNPAMTDDRETEETEETGNGQPIAAEAMRLASEVKHMTDSDADVDYSALAKLDEIPEDEAIKLLDEIMRGLLFD